MTKSEIFKAAWKMKKENGCTFSNALKASWSKAKFNCNTVFNANGTILPLRTKGAMIWFKSLLGRSYIASVAKEVLESNINQSPDALQAAYNSLINLNN